MELKDLTVGQIIYAIPTGNNARYSKEVKQFRVEKIKRKYVDLLDSCYWDDKYKPTNAYCIKTGATQGATQGAINMGYGFNAGYVFFESLEAIELHKNKNELAEIVRRKLRFEYFRNYSLEDLKTISEVINKY